MSYFIPCLLAIVFLYNPLLVYAQNSQLNANKLVSKIKKELNLSDQQEKDIAPIIKKYMAKRQEYLNSLEGELSVNKKKVKTIILNIREDENQELSKVLTPEQMKRLVHKQRLRDGLNKDQINFSDAYGGEIVMGGQGGSFKF